MGNIKFLILSADKVWRKRAGDLLTTKAQDPTIFTTSDGADTLLTLKTSPPDVLLVDLKLSEVSSTHLLDKVFKNSDFKNVATIVTGAQPSSDEYSKEVTSGRLNFIKDRDDNGEFLRAVDKALSFCEKGAKVVYRSRLLVPGELLIKEGDTASCVYILKSGQLAAYHVVNGRKDSVGLIGAGEFVGEMSYINAAPRCAHVEAVIASEVIEIPIGTFESILYQNPCWSKALVQTLSKRLLRCVGA